VWFVKTWQISGVVKTEQILDAEMKNKFIKCSAK
jgi:hypothetical protein